MLKKSDHFLLNKEYSLALLIGLHGLSTLVGYLMPNPVDTYILKMINKHIL